MIYGRYFCTASGNVASPTLDLINNGLQQGTINSPILFTIYTCDLLNLFGSDRTGCILLAFADNLIVYKADKTPEKVRESLQLATDKIFRLYKQWKLKVNTDKCEAILFRPFYKIASQAILRQYKNFEIRESVKGGERIATKMQVKYLGILLDNRLLLNKHPLQQLEKVRKVFMANANLFYLKGLNSKVKLICDQLLVRPTLTYGYEIWYNVGASLMEKIRTYKRKCITVCLGKYVSKSSNYTKYISNEEIYNKANLNRIDNFIIKLISNYFTSNAQIKQNSLIFSIAYQNERYIQRTLISGYILPEAFIYVLRQEGLYPK